MQSFSAVDPYAFTTSAGKAITEIQLATLSPKELAQVLQTKINRFATLSPNPFTPLVVDGVIGSRTVDSLILALKKSPLGIGFATDPGYGPLTPKFVQLSAANLIVRLEVAANQLGAPAAGSVPATPPKEPATPPKKPATPPTATKDTTVPAPPPGPLDTTGGGKQQSGDHTLLWVGAGIATALGIGALVKGRKKAGRSAAHAASELSEDEIAALLADLEARGEEFE